MINFKNLWLLLTGLILSTVVLTTGNAAYKDKINQLTSNIDQNKEVVEDEQSTIADDIPQQDLTQTKEKIKQKSTPVLSKENITNSEKQPKQDLTNQSQNSNKESQQETDVTNDSQEQSKQIPTSSTTETSDKKQSPTPTPTISESKQTQTITQTVKLSIQSLSDYQVEYKDGDTAWDIMKRAAAKYTFAMSYQVFDFGIYVSKIGELETHDNYYWALYYNNSYSMFGVSDLKVNPNDKILWKYETWSW